jgi:hypothetical protein
VGTVISFQGEHWLAASWLVGNGESIINANHSQLKIYLMRMRQAKKSRVKRGVRKK